MYSGPIIDAHHHLWDYALARHPWLRPGNATVTAIGGLEQLRRNFLPEDYRADFADEGIVGSVHIEALWESSDLLGETIWLEGLDKSGGIAARYVAGAPLGSSSGAEIVRKQAAFKNVTGIRGILSHHPVKSELSFVARGDLAYDEKWRGDVAVLHEAGLNLELMMYPYQAQAVSDLARAFPDLQIIINHCGSPIDRDEEGMQRWRDGLALIARHPNIALKISNVGAYDSEWSYESVKMVVEDCMKAFGYHRCMFGTDYPVSNLNMKPGNIFQNFRKATSDAPLGCQEALFYSNARKIYNF
ncbi:amidohydrolase family protein [Mesorhizobium sp. AaZ16]